MNDAGYHRDHAPGARYVLRPEPAIDVVVHTSVDPLGYRSHRLNTLLFQPPANEVLTLDTTETAPKINAKKIHQALIERGVSPYGS